MSDVGLPEETTHARFGFVYSALVFAEPESPPKPKKKTMNEGRLAPAAIHYARHMSQGSPRKDQEMRARMVLDLNAGARQCDVRDKFKVKFSDVKTLSRKMLTHTVEACILGGRGRGIYDRKK